jgi:predicted ATPase with chaperone activity
LLNGKKSWISLQVNPDQLLKKRSVYDVDFQDVRRQYQARRVMEVAVAGVHNIITF